MSRLFTHHDRLYLYNGSPTASQTEAFPGKGKEMTETDEDDTPSKHFSAISVYVPHFHKAFGLCALLNMLLYLTPKYETFYQYFGPERLVRFSLIHVILAMSSFEFRIGRARNGIYTIYREMQLHTIIFTFRSWAVLVGTLHFGLSNIVTRSIVVLFWHFLADLATHFYRPPSGETTIRRAVNGKKGYQDQGRIAHMGLWFFSFSQLVGTYMLLTDSSDCVRDSMFIMTPVQVSAFLATLVRKGYFRSQTSVAVYFMVLLPIFFYHHWTLLDLACVVAAQLLRFQLRLNKYIMWVGIAMTVAFLHGDLQQFATYYFGPSAAGLPTPPPLPSWFTVDTVQPGSWIGENVSALYRSLTA